MSYRDHATLSRQFYDAASVIPGRSSTRSKAPGKFFPIDAGPLYARSASGCRIEDVDGRLYIDMLCALGAISVGYGKTPAPTSLGVMSLPSYVEVETANIVLRLVAPWATSVKFVKTGSEAVHAAVMVARAATRKSVVLVAENSYHGWHSWVNASFDDDGNRVDPMTNAFCFANGDTWATGVPVAYSSAIRTYRYGDIESVRALTRDGSVGAILVEPARWVDANHGFLADVRKHCSEIGAQLIFDEMIYGGRWALGGASEFYDVVPDLACYGKAFGNGAAVAFVVGTAALDTYGSLVSGTYGGDVTGLSAIAATLRVLTKQSIATLWDRGRQLRSGLRQIVSDASLCATLEGRPVHQRLRFWDRDNGLRFSAEMAKRGVLWHPECVNIMLAHTEQDIELVLAAAAESADAVRS